MVSLSKKFLITFQHILIEVIREETRLLPLISAPLSGFKKNPAHDGRRQIIQLVTESLFILAVLQMSTHAHSPFQTDCQIFVAKTQRPFSIISDSNQKTCEGSHCIIRLCFNKLNSHKEQHFVDNNNHLPSLLRSR